eukprot:6192521-Pleurochrysis_carterae.AAC.1
MAEEPANEQDKWEGRLLTFSLKVKRNWSLKNPKVRRNQIGRSEKSIGLLIEAGPKVRRNQIRRSEKSIGLLRVDRFAERRRTKHILESLVTSVKPVFVGSVDLRLPHRGRSARRARYSSPEEPEIQGRMGRLKLGPAEIRRKCKRAEHERGSEQKKRPKKSARSHGQRV